MIPLIMSAFDRLVPGPLKFEVKEAYYAFEYLKNNLGRGKETFSQVEVEINSDCNRKCRICPNHSESRGHGRMDLEVFDLLLGQLASMDFSGSLAPQLFSEPLLDGRLIDLMGRTRKKLPNVEIIIYTNGSLLTPDGIKTLIDSGVDGIFVSQYEDNLPVDGKVRKVISALAPEYKAHIRYRMLRADSYLYNRGGLVDVQNPVRKKRCFKASNNLIVDHLGNVVLCCNDYKTDNRYGNIQKDDILTIWNKPAFRDVRGKLRRGDFVSSPDLCKYCVGMKYRK